VKAKIEDPPPWMEDVNTHVGASLADARVCPGVSGCSGVDKRRPYTSIRANREIRG